MKVEELIEYLRNGYEDMNVYVDVDGQKKEILSVDIGNDDILLVIED